jgi:(R,R)-butanediol dehydrogenase/meso-butanediol dehydrogenase/diacetyl reductase
MKAAVFKALGAPLEVETVGDPVPAPDEVLIRVGRCGICGSDLHMTEDPIFGLPSGTVLGHEYAGEIVETGAGIEHLHKGDRIAVLPIRGCGRCASCLAGQPAWCREMRLEGGGYGQFSIAREPQCVRLPSTVSLADGALVEPLAVGLHGVKLSGLTPGARVLVIGAGPIGLAVTFWLRRLGAGKIAVSAASDRRANLAREMGADAFVAACEDPAGAVNRALGGPPEIVFEAVGKPGLIQRSIDHVGPRGTVVVLGLCTATDQFQPFAAVAKEVRIQASAFYDARDFEIAVDALDSGAVEPTHMVTESIALSALPEAFEALRHRSTQCKVLVDPWAG